jgi:hypothetical protein
LITGEIALVTTAAQAAKLSRPNPSSGALAWNFEYLSGQEMKVRKSAFIAGVTLNRWGGSSSAGWG